MRQVLRYTSVATLSILPHVLPDAPGCRSEGCLTHLLG